MRFKCVLAFSAAEAALYITAPFGRYLIHDLKTAAGYELILLPLVVFPSFCCAAGFVTQLKCGFAPLLALLTAVFFVPAAMLHYGSPAFAYAAAYGAASLIGMLSAYPVRRLRDIKRSREKGEIKDRGLLR